MDLTGAHWRKSSYSSNGGGNCVEIAWVDTISWRKSSYSANGGNNSNCVEVGWGRAATAVRDSKNPEVTPLVFSAVTWEKFVARLG